VTVQRRWISHNSGRCDDRGKKRGNGEEEEQEEQEEEEEEEEEEDGLVFFRHGANESPESCSSSHCSFSSPREGILSAADTPDRSIVMSGDSDSAYALESNSHLRSIRPDAGIRSHQPIQWLKVEQNRELLRGNEEGRGGISPAASKEQTGLAYPTKMCGVGLEVEHVHDNHIISRIYKGGSAEISGIVRIGDALLMVRAPRRNPACTRAK
jgi:hypothetical protein